MKGKVIEKIANIEPFATKTEKIVIKGLESIDHKDLIYMSITELAIKLNVAEATILRFCKKLGYSGFQDFKLEVSRDLDKEIIQFSDDAANLLNNKITKALVFTIKNLKNASIDEVAQRIFSAKKVCIFGVGNSYISTMFMRDNLIKIGINPFSSSDSHIQSIVATNLSSEDLVILISVSGSTIDIIDVAKICRDKNTPVVVVTNYINSPLAKYASSLLVSSTKVAAYEGGSASSIISQIFILDLVFQRICELMGPEGEEKVANTSKRVSNKAI